MNRSSKFNFFLPQNTDPIEVSDFNSNFETIDANLLTKAQNLSSEQKAAVRANVDLNVANNLTTTEAGSVLDARQGKAINDKILNSAFPIYSGTGISSATNFNSLTTPGIYTVYQDAVAQGSSNCPSLYAGKLCVFSLSGSPFTSAWQYGEQIYKDRVGNEYVRAVSSNSSGEVTFGNWRATTSSENLSPQSYSHEGVTIAGNGQVADIDFTITKSGYKFLGVTGWIVNSGGTASVVYIWRNSDTNVRVRLINNAAASVTTGSIWIHCLYVRE